VTDLIFHTDQQKPAGEQLEGRQQLLRQAGVMANDLFSTQFEAETIDTISSKNCENLVGSVEIPVGVAGPVRVQSQLLDTSVVIPIATTEGALVASINRGAKALEQAGGVEVISQKIGMTRAPVFRCLSGQQATELAAWLKANFSSVAEIMAATSSHLQLIQIQTWVRGRLLFARFVCDSDQAMGMNMITIAIDHLWQQLQQQQQFLQQFADAKMVTISSNVCTDKKDSAINQILGRGYWVQAEAVISHTILQQVLKTSAEAILATHMAKNDIGSTLAGSHSHNMQVANVVAGIFLANGQDPAHVVEASQAMTIIEPDPAGIYISVTLPSLNLGVVGGGTWLPAQRQARELILSGQPITAQQLAEVTAAAVLAGELSGMAALSAGQLARAHQELGR
jgi:hydroxymethylglutaryl-CoA reductase (NADPH)